MRVDRVLGQIERDFPEHLARAQRYVRQPSVSVTGEGVEAMAQLVCDDLTALGARTSVVATAGNPVVFGRLDAGQARTLLVYGMYDVQPAQEPDWRVPPFGGEIVDEAGLGRVLMSRGATNSKGPLAGFINVVAAIRDAGEPLPVNFLFMIEGEEELGSRHLPEFVAAHAPALAAADAVYFPAFRQDRAGTAMMQLGTKGHLWLELRARGGAWGGPRERAVHGAYSVWLGSPAWRLVAALSTLVGPDERVRTPGFYEQTLAPDPDDLEAIAALAADGDLTAILAEYGATRFKHVGPPAELLRRFFFEPVLNLDGFRGGHAGAGTKSLIPHEMVARLDARLSPTASPEAVADQLRAHLVANGYDDIEVTVLSARRGSKISAREPVAQALQRAYRDMGVRGHVHPVNVGWVPLYLFETVLRRPYVLGGLGHGERQHSSDELMTVDGFRRFEACAVWFLSHFAESSGRLSDRDAPAGRA